MANSKRKKIFLVDDDSSQTDLMKLHLESKYKLDISVFSTGEDCLDHLDENADYIVLDYNLDRVKKDAMNGIEVLKKIKEKLPEVFVIFLSGQDKIEVAVDTLKFGAYDYVVKNASGMLRVENILKNIHHNMRLQQQASMYKKATFFLIGVILLIIIVAVVLRLLGVSTDNVLWA